jgi:hypothetical protein
MSCIPGNSKAPGARRAAEPRASRTERPEPCGSYSLGAHRALWSLRRPRSALCELLAQVLVTALERTYPPVLSRAVDRGRVNAAAGGHRR